MKTFAFPHSLELAWDLDGTLVTSIPVAKASEQKLDTAPFYYDDRYACHPRPGAAAVLRLLSVGNRQHLFTAATRPYADAIVDALLPPGAFSSRLYREALSESGSHGKDLRRLCGGDAGALARALLVDDQARNRVGAQHLLWVPPYEPGAGAARDAVLWRVAGVVLLHNFAGPAAFAALHWLDAPPAPRLLPPPPPAGPAHPA